jgi:cytochrome c2
MRWLGFLLLMGLLSLGVTACDSGVEAKASLPEPESVGDPILGEEIFNSSHRPAPACATCHIVESEQGELGIPSLHTVANRAGEQVKGMDAVAYLRHSIVDPAAFDAAPESSTQMYEHFADIFSEQDINNLIAYLLMLRS